MKIAFSPAYVPLLSRVMARGDIRYYLNGIRVEPSEKGGVYLVATNGHCMVIIHDKHGVFEGDPSHYASLRLTPWMVTACKSRDAKTYAARVLLDGKRLSLGTDFGMEHSPTEIFVQAGDPIVNGAFPSWRRLLPDFDKLESGGFAGGAVNVELLSYFAVRNGDFSSIRLWQQAGAGGYDPTFIQMCDMPEALGIVMPSRQDISHEFEKHMPKRAA